MELELSDIIRIFKRWKWLFLISTILIAASTVGVYEILPKKYEISSVIRVEGTKASSFSLGGFSIPLGNEGNVDDYIEIMKSRSIVENVIRKKNLLEKILNREDLEKFKKQGYSDEDLLELAYRTISKNLEVSTLGKSALINIRYKSKDPKVGYEIVSGIIAEFKKKIENMRSQSIRKKTEFLDEKRKQTYEEFKEKVSELVEFQKRNGVVSLEDELLNLKSMEYQIETTLSASKVALSKLKDENSKLLKEFRNSSIHRDFQMVEYLNKEISDLEAQLSALQAVYPKDYIEIRKTKAQIEDLKSKLELVKSSLMRNPIGFSEMGKMISENTLNLKSSEIKIASGEKVLKEIRKKIEKLVELEKQFTSIKADIEVYKDLLSFIWQQQIQTMLSELSTVYPVTVISPPKYTHVPKEVSKILLGAVGLSIGIFFGVLIVFWKESSHKNVTDHIIFARMNGIDEYYTIRRGKLNIDIERIVADMRKVRGKVLVCSPSDGDGKSTISLKLAERLSDIGREVLLIDGDSDRKDLSKRFGFSEQPGSKNKKEFKIGKVHFLPFADWRNIPNNFDVVIIDSPSYEKKIVDLLNLADMADFVLLIISEMGSNRTLSEELYRKLEEKIFGVAFNKVRWLS